VNVQYLVLTINNFLTRLNYKFNFQLLSFFLNKKFDSSGILWLGSGGGSRGGLKAKSRTQYLYHNFLSSK
jgi:hypothetical protein